MSSPRTRASTSTRRSRSSRAGTVFTTHTPVPAGIDRFPRDLVEQYFGGDNASRGVPVDKILALGAEDYEGGDPARLQHGGDGLPALAARQRRLAAARRGQPRHVRRPLARVRRRRAADRLDHQRRARAHLGRPRGVRPGRASRASDPDAGPTADSPEAVFEVADAVPAERIWAVKRHAARAAGRGRPPPAARVAGPSAALRRPSSPGSTTCSTPTCSPSGSPAASRRTSGSR